MRVSSRTTISVVGWPLAVVYAPRHSVHGPQSDCGSCSIACVGLGATVTLCCMGNSSVVSVSPRLTPCVISHCCPSTEEACALMLRERFALYHTVADQRSSGRDMAIQEIQSWHGLPLVLASKEVNIGPGGEMHDPCPFRPSQAAYSAGTWMGLQGRATGSLH